MYPPQPLGLEALESCFPVTGKYRNGPWKGQQQIMEFVAGHGSSTVESPTGTGKTAVEYAILEAARQKLSGSCFLITPNKTLVTQISQEFPGMKIALGRSEHECLYYEQPYRADEIPCSMLKDCPHRVDQTTGETHEKGSIPCPYLLQKFQAKQGGAVVSTMAFYLFTQLFSHEFGERAVLVVDEAHRIADVVRNGLSYEITDWHLEQSAQLLDRINADEADVLKKFLQAIRRIAKGRGRNAGEEKLLEDDEIRRLMNILIGIDANALLKKIAQAVQRHEIDLKEDRVVLKRLETLVRDLRRYIHSFEYSLEEEGRKPLNYTCAFYKSEKGEHDKVQYKLVIKCYYVAPLVKKILAPFTVAFSATIGNNETFGYETGIKQPFLSLGSNFPANNTRVYLPKDTPNLAMNSRNRQDLTRTLRRIAKACVRFRQKGHRSLVVTISNTERAKFLELAGEEGLNALSYGNGVTAREAAQQFKDGAGDTLVGTAANYSEGVDLPKQVAPVIFFLRPGYPNPRDAGTQFEERRFGNQRWALWNWRVMQQALQVRGRNIRSRSDQGVTFFISQQFKRVLYAALPEWLEPAYRNALTFDQAIDDAEKLLSL